MKTPTNKWRRMSVITHFQPPIPGGKSRNTWTTTTRPTPSTPGTAGPATTAMPSTSPKSDSNANPSGYPQTSTGTEVATTSLPNQSPPGVKTKRKKGRRKPKTTLPPVHWPRGGRPKPQEEPVQSPGGPEGQVPYRDGPRYKTSSPTMGFIGELSRLNQSICPVHGTPDDVGNIRTILQVIEPDFFSQHGTFDTSSTREDGYDDTHTIAFTEIMNGLNAKYTRKFTVNNTYQDNFTTEKLLVYFKDNHKLLCELVCLLQRGAYYRDEGREMENPLLDYIGNLLNHTSIDDIRNSMARALHYQYLPDETVKQVYEIFQTYRQGSRVTAQSNIYVTPAMFRLLYSVAGCNNDDDVKSRINDYAGYIKKLINNVTSRPNRTDAHQDTDIVRMLADPSSSATSDQVSYNTSYTFPVGSGGLSSSERRVLNSFLDRIRTEAKLHSLSYIPPGNSQSAYDVGYCDSFNNTMALIDSYQLPKPYVHNVSKDSSSFYCAEKPENEIEYNDIQFMMQNYAGCAPFLFYLSNRANRITLQNGNTSTRYFMEHMERNLNVSEEFDLRATFKVHDIDCTSVNSYKAKPIIQDNYVVKIVNIASTYFGVANPDGTAVSEYFFTKARLTEMQKNVAPTYFGC